MHACECHSRARDTNREPGVCGRDSAACRKHVSVFVKIVWLVLFRFISFRLLAKKNIFMNKTKIIIFSVSYNCIVVSIHL